VNFSATNPDPRRWLILVVIASAQMMVVLDATIVNIALPSAQAALGISDVDKQWVITAYALTFGGFLLLGGRIADYWGRKKTFLLGMLGFAAASALGGIATTPEVLFAARALQGTFGALLAPAGLAILTTTFHDPDERAKAFAVFGAVAAGGAAVGLLLGGILTELLNWRWCLLVNTPVAILVAFFTYRIVTESKTRATGNYDIAGALLGTLGLVSLVYGFTKAGETSWGNPTTIAFLAAAVVLLGLFVAVELRTKNPLLPMRILLDRNRGGSYMTSVLLGAAIFGSSLFLTYYFQQVLDYTPIEAGLASLPISLGVFAAAGGVGRVLTRFGPRPIMALGAIFGTVGMLLLAQIDVESSFWALVFPGEILFGLGMGMIFVPLSNLALINVEASDAGAASAVLNASQQVGGSLGTALLSSLSVAATDRFFSNNPNLANVQQEALVHGFSVGFYWAAVLMFLAAIIIFVMVKAGREDIVEQDGAAVPVG
jgi:EmrB/QacA subfamily drug resistance transporter